MEKQLELLEESLPKVNAVQFFGDSDIERGEVFTRPEVVNFILDLTCWSIGNDFSNLKLLEPSAGSGDFIVPAAQRLLESRTWAPSELQGRIKAVEVNRGSLSLCRKRLTSLLEKYGYSRKDRELILKDWLVHDDFLTTRFDGQFTHVVGNPPYVRQEALPPPLLKLYRARYQTMYDRADLYVPFFERGLSLLSPHGRLGFICADRWMKNKYGGPLRNFISSGFHLEHYADFTGCPAFLEEVVAYPAVIVIKRGEGSETRTTSRPEISDVSLQKLAREMQNPGTSGATTTVAKVVSGSAPWLLENPGRLNIIRELEDRLPTLEQAHCKVGIGVATGLDQVYIKDDKDLPIERERKIPLALTKDIVDGELVWSGKVVLNPFDGNTPSLVEPSRYPLFQDYLEKHRERIEKRHVAKKNPTNWFKTIDRIYPSLAKTPKLLIPDIKGEATVIYDPGKLYPHHNFYFVTSEDWDLHALQAVLLSSVAQAFIATYSLRMRGDCLRYQAQYLRRIRLPLWSEICPQLKAKLIAAGRTRSRADIEEATQLLYGLSAHEWMTLKS